MDFSTIAGYEVKKKEVLEMVEKYNWNRNTGFIRAIESFIRLGGSPMGDFELIREEEKYFIVRFYQGDMSKTEFNVQETLNRIPLIFFGMLKCDFDSKGEPHFYLVETLCVVEP
jgi:hypothetical protein